MKRTAQNQIAIPGPTHRRFYGHGIPKFASQSLAGRLIVVEGADGSGRSTQIAMLVEWLEGGGHATVQVGLKRSTLVSEELARAQEGNILSRTTLSMFYATDFADQLENIILPALKAGFLVLADRYIYTLMARDMVRGMDEAWLKNLYGIALEPDTIVMEVKPGPFRPNEFADWAPEENTPAAADLVSWLQRAAPGTRWDDAAGRRQGDDSVAV